MATKQTKPESSGDKYTDAAQEYRTRLDEDYFPTLSIYGLDADKNVVRIADAANTPTAEYVVRKNEPDFTGIRVFDNHRNEWL